MRGGWVHSDTCYQCGESKGAVKASQAAGDPIFCAIVDYEGECIQDWDRHRFALPRRQYDIWREAHERPTLWIGS